MSIQFTKASLQNNLQKMQKDNPIWPQSKKTNKKLQELPSFQSLKKLLKKLFKFHKMKIVKSSKENGRFFHKIKMQ